MTTQTISSPPVREQPRQASLALLLANGVLARLMVREPGGSPPWREVMSWAWPQRRWPRQLRFAAGPAGRERHGHWAADSLEPHAEIDDLDHERFAQHIGQELGQWLHRTPTDAAATPRAQLDDWVVIASPAMLGTLRRALPLPCRRRLRWTSDTDLTRYRGEDLSQRLQRLAPAPADLRWDRLPD